MQFKHDDLPRYTLGHPFLTPKVNVVPILLGLIWTTAVSGTILLARYGKKYGVLIAGVSMLVLGNTMQQVYDPIRDIMQKCTGNILPPGSGLFPPGSAFSSTCLYETDIDQDLIFWAEIEIERQSIPIPTIVQIRGPDGQLLKEEEFDSARVVVQLKPTAFGMYTATITSLEEQSDPRAPLSGGRGLQYAFGHLASGYFTGVSNASGNNVNTLLFTSYILNFAGFLMIIIYVTKSVYIAVSRTLHRKRN